eukprot:1887701-Pleurochrysis_carterae.AAC.2
MISSPALLSSLPPSLSLSRALSLSLSLCVCLSLSLSLTLSLSPPSPQPSTSPSACPRHICLSWLACVLRYVVSEDSAVLQLEHAIDQRQRRRTVRDQHEGALRGKGGEKGGG